MFDVIAGLLGSLIGGSIGQRRERRKAANRMEEFDKGEKVQVPCALRYEGDSTWRHGDLIVSRGDAHWSPPAMTVRAIHLDPSEVIVDSVRNVGIKESWGASPNCFVLSCSLGDRRFELAIPKEDLGPIRVTFNMPA